MKKLLGLSVFCVTLVIVGLLIGCGGGTTTAVTTTTAANTTTSTSSTTSTTATAGSTITLSGALSSGTIYGSGIIQAAAATSAYSIVAVDNATGYTYFTTPDATGNFSLDLPANASVEVSLINSSSSNYFGPIIMSGNSSSDEVVMGLTLATSTDVGTIVVDASQAIAQTQTTPASSILNTNDTAQATNGVPIGAGEYGKNAYNGLTNSDGADIDGDGIPNPFDADKDNDGIREGILSANQVSSAKIENCEITSQLLTTHGRTIYSSVSSSQEAYTLMSIRITVTPTSAEVSNVESVAVISVPSSINSTAKVSTTSDGNWLETYPSEGTSWSSTNYKLYQRSAAGDTNWMVVIRPYAWPQLGDTFVVRVTYLDGTYEDLAPTMAFVMKDVARITSINGTSTSSGSAGSEANDTFTIGATTSAYVVWNTPKDENNDVMAGLVHYIVYGTSEGNVPTNSTTVLITNETTASSLSATLPLETNQIYYIMPYAAFGSGMRAGEEFWAETQ